MGDMLKRLIAVYLIGLAVIVAVNFMIVPVYHEPGTEAYPVWEVLNWFQAVSIIIALSFMVFANAPWSKMRMACSRASI